MKCKESVVWTTTSDEIEQAGVVMVPESKNNSAVVWIHGLYQNAFDKLGVLIGRELSNEGHVFISGNNRGHDFGALLKRSGKEPLPGGGGWEIFEDSDEDIEAWINFVTDNYDVDQIILAGHSFGARKAVHYLYRAQNPKVAGLALLSARTTYKEADREKLRIATELVESGRGKDLIPWPEHCCSMSAETYLRHKDSKARFQNLFIPNGPISEITLPLLVVSGNNEPEIEKIIEELENIKRQAILAKSFSIEIVESADHYFSGQEVQVANIIIQWLKTI